MCPTLLHFTEVFILMKEAALPAHYYACLMRIWREDEDAPWRVLIQHVSSNERLLFPDLLAAFAFIEGELAEALESLPISHRGKGSHSLEEQG